MRLLFDYKKKVKQKAALQAAFFHEGAACHKAEWCKQEMQEIMFRQLAELCPPVRRKTRDGIQKRK